MGPRVLRDATDHIVNPRWMMTIPDKKANDVVVFIDYKNRFDYIDDERMWKSTLSLESRNTFFIGKSVRQGYTFHL